VERCIWHAMCDILTWLDICAGWVCGQRATNV